MNSIQFKCPNWSNKKGHYINLYMYTYIIIRCGVGLQTVGSLGRLQGASVWPIDWFINISHDIWTYNYAGKERSTRLVSEIKG